MYIIKKNDKHSISMKKRNVGIFVVSLDFELFWGVADIARVEQWENKIKKVYEIVPKTLQLFEKYDIHATWATVAGIMLKDEKELYEYLPAILPEQTRQIMNMFSFDDEANRIPSFMLFGNDLVEMVKKVKGQEIGTHTFTHYYCDKTDSKESDLKYEATTSISIMKHHGYGKCKSIVFPRNQVKKEFVDALPESIRIYRGSIKGYINILRKRCPKIGTFVWYLDHYIFLQRSTYYLSEIKDGKRFNVRLSRLFKGYKSKYRFLEVLKVLRYKMEMWDAAKNGRVYHLCWHPHNFSENTDINFRQLEKLLKYYNFLKNKYGFISLNMCECVEKYREK